MKTFSLKLLGTFIYFTGGLETCEVLKSRFYCKSVGDAQIGKRKSYEIEGYLWEDYFELGIRNHKLSTTHLILTAGVKYKSNFHRVGISLRK